MSTSAIEIDTQKLKSISHTPQIDLLLDMNRKIHQSTKLWLYHINHLYLVEEYAFIINHLLEDPCDPKNLSTVAFAHDTFKERSLDVTREMTYGRSLIPQDTGAYVRTNLDVLEKFRLDDYFNTSIQYHGLAIAIWLYKELGIENPEIIYPICFHSCPIMEVYQNLPYDVQLSVDIIMLADKLSSNYLKINLLEKPVRCDLDLIVFGNSGCEFNYTTGLAVARMIANGKNEERFGLESTQFYWERACSMNPFLPKKFSAKLLGGNKIWPKRNSQRLMTD